MSIHILFSSEYDILKSYLFNIYKYLFSISFIYRHFWPKIIFSRYLFSIFIRHSDIENMIFIRLYKISFCYVGRHQSIILYCFEKNSQTFDPTAQNPPTFPETRLSLTFPGFPYPWRPWYTGYLSAGKSQRQFLEVGS